MKDKINVILSEEKNVTLMVLMLFSVTDMTTDPLRLFSVQHCGGKGDHCQRCFFFQRNEASSVAGSQSRS